ncbi:MAG: DMT family transporter [Actinomycetales bacterium]|nr:DMT family transporter [Actinomycetales bacterium]
MTDTESPRARIVLLAAIAFTVLAWASAFIVIRGVAPVVGGGELALGRLLVGAVALGSLVLIGRRWVAPTGREWIRLAVYGLGWFGVYNVALNLAEQVLDAGTAAMLVNIGPLLIALGAGLFLGEGLPRWLLVGAGVAFLGVVLISVGTTLASAGGRPIDPLGVVGCLVAAVTYAVGVLAQKPLTRRLPAAQVALIGCVIGALACLPFAGALVADLAVAAPPTWLGIVYLGLVPTALAFTTWGYALGRMPASQLGVTTYIVPPLTIAAGWFVFGEVPPWLAIAGGVLALGGVALSRRSSRPRATAAAPGAVAPASAPTGAAPAAVSDSSLPRGAAPAAASDSSLPRGAAPAAAPAAVSTPARDLSE